MSPRLFSLACCVAAAAAASLTPTATTRAGIDKCSSSWFSRPPRFAAADGVTSVAVPGNTHYDADDYGRGDGWDYCGGPSGCERECCGRADCIGWSFNTAGSSHYPCGASDCTLLVTSQPYAAWGDIVSRTNSYSSTGDRGTAYSGAAPKAACCPSPTRTRTRARTPTRTRTRTRTPPTLPMSPSRTRAGATPTRTRKAK